MPSLCVRTNYRVENDKYQQLSAQTTQQVVLVMRNYGVELRKSACLNF
jgi:hypothetical protein